MLIAPQKHSIARRAGFTLLEVLVVVAIIVILAGGASVYVFGYLEDAKINQARTTMKMLEDAATNYATMNGNPPVSLMELVSPTSGGRPLINGGPAMLVDPWGNEYQYNPEARNGYGDPAPQVWTTTNGQQLFSTNKRS
jgi:general secretion pathway protein G